MSPHEMPDMPSSLALGSQRMSRQPPTFATVLDRVGDGVMMLQSRPTQLDRPVRNVVIHDSMLATEVSPDHILLAVGINPGSHDAYSLLTTAQSSRCAAIVFRTQGNISEPLIVAARQHGVLLLSAANDVTWVQLATMLRMSIGAGASDALTTSALGDLFGFVNALATRVGGAVTLEDTESRILAYSNLPDEIDEARKLTILGRQVPAKYTAALNERGILAALSSTDDIVHVDAMPDLGLRSRTAVSVRAAGELLGFLWIAEGARSLAADSDRIIQEASQAAALHLVRERLNQREDSEARRDLLRDLLDGGPSPDIAIARLGMRHDVPYSVIAFEATDADTSTEQTAHAIEAYCSSYSKGATVVSVGMRVYAVVPHLTHESTRKFVTAGAERVRNALRAPTRATFCAKPAAVENIVNMRQEADRAMRVLIHRGQRDAVASLDDVRSEAALLQVHDFMRDNPHLLTGKVSQLLETPSPRDSALIDTLSAFLSHFGAIPEAAASMQVHPNTFRYRLARALDVTGLDLTNPEEVLMTQLQLRLASSYERPVVVL